MLFIPVKKRLFSYFWYKYLIRHINENASKRPKVKLRFDAKSLSFNQ